MHGGVRKSRPPLTFPEEQTWVEFRRLLYCFFFLKQHLNEPCFLRPTFCSPPSPNKCSKLKCAIYARTNAPNGRVYFSFYLSLSTIQHRVWEAALPNPWHGFGNLSGNDIICTHSSRRMQRTRREYSAPINMHAQVAAAQRNACQHNGVVTWPPLDPCTFGIDSKTLMCVFKALYA